MKWAASMKKTLHLPDNVSIGKGISMNVTKFHCLATSAFDGTARGFTNYMPNFLIDLLAVLGDTRVPVISSNFLEVVAALAGSTFLKAAVIAFS